MWDLIVSVPDHCLSSRNSQTFTTRFRISELRNLVKKFSTLLRWGFSTADKSFALEQLLKVVHRGGGGGGY